MSVLGTHLYQHTSWCCCERVHSASVIFFGRIFQCICPFHDGWFMSAPAHATLSGQQFLTKTGMTPMPRPPYSPSLALSNGFLLFPRWKKSSKGNILLMWKKWYKMSEALKDIKIKFKNCFEQWKKHLDRCITSNGEYFEGDWCLNMLRINTHFL